MRTTAFYIILVIFTPLEWHWGWLLFSILLSVTTVTTKNGGDNG